MAQPAKKPNLNLTIYLAKAEYDSPDALLKSIDRLESFRIGSGRGTVGTLYVQRPHPKPPRWARFFQEYFDVRQLGKVASAAAALIVAAKGRLFAITFGHGRHLLTSEAWEERFGLRVALNCVGENNVRSIDKLTFDAISRHSREQASHETAARDFGLDIERDLLRAVTGTPTEAIFGNRMYGMDALNVSINAEIRELPAVLARYHEKFLDSSYKKSFPWVDQIAEVKSPGLQEELDRSLFTRISSGNLDRVWMAVPEVIQWDRISEFRYRRGARSPGYNDIHLQDFLKSLDDPSNINKDIFLRRHVLCIDNDGLTLDKWQAYRCLYVEIDLGDDSFFLSGGKWYKVTKDFVAEVNKAYQQIPSYTRQLPEYNDESETAYNQRVANAAPSTFALMDRKMILHGGGYSQVEFCDLYTKDRDIVHVKRYGGSSVLSHLFAQGLISGELFLTDLDFREKVNKKLPSNFQLQDATKRPGQGEYRVVFAVISDMPGELVLPFFSRLNLKHAARRLEAYGYRVERAKVEVDEILSKLKKF